MDYYRPQVEDLFCDSNKVAMIQKIFGRCGELVIKLWDNFPEDFKGPFWIEIESEKVPLFIDSIKSQGQSKAVVVFEDWQSESLARELVGKSLYADIKEDESEYDSGSLVGWSFIDECSGNRGRITDFNESETNPLLFVVLDEMNDGNKEYIIPLAEEFVISVDDKKETLVLSLPDGIFDL